MFFYIKLAWRNIFRNKRRTIITGIAIGIGLASMIFTDALFVGMIDSMIDSVTSSFLGEAQIHRHDFRATQEIEQTIIDAPEVISQLKKEPHIKSFTERTISNAMISSPSSMNSVILYGIEPAHEKNISEIDNNIIKGKYLDEHEDRGLLIGEKLADILEVGTGDRVVITVAQAGTGEIIQELFRVKGIYQMQIEEFEKGTAFITIKKAQQMLGLNGRIHEIAVDFDNADYALNAVTPFTVDFSQHGNEAANWPQIVPEMKVIFEMSGVSITFMSIIIFGVVVFGIINTLFMSLYERMFEFGVLRAVGTRASGLIKMIVFEAGALAFVSIIIGIILGLTAVLIVSKTGVDYRGLEMAGATFTKILHPVLRIRQFILYPVLVFIFTIAVSFYPAVKAAKMQIVEALRKSL
jgi:ABC-type lipoprotein release transport system permease subunit